MNKKDSETIIKCLGAIGVVCTALYDYFTNKK